MMKTFPDFFFDSEEKKISLSNLSGSSVPELEKEFTFLLKSVEQEENVCFRLVEVVYVGEQEIVEINKKHFVKNHVTDIISFRYDDDNDQAIEGTLACCAPRILEQSGEFNTQPKDEFYRVFVHGLLHLAGYDDRTREEKEKMTALEDRYLGVLYAETQRRGEGDKESG